FSQLNYGPGKFKPLTFPIAIGTFSQLNYGPGKFKPLTFPIAIGAFSQLNYGPGKSGNSEWSLVNSKNL
ncbi:MAG: hypothetical protein ACE5KJ_04180, partial [Candidatus Zixiibacteriota bacterium]